MDSCAVSAAIGFKGKVKGRTGSPKLEVRVRDTLVCDFSGPAGCSTTPPPTGQN
jgi:hypothetical protein